MSTSPLSKSKIVFTQPFMLNLHGLHTITLFFCFDILDCSLLYQIMVSLHEHEEPITQLLDKGGK